MGNYAAFGFGQPRFGNWATHGLGLTTFVPPPAEPTYPPLRTFIVVGDDAIPVVRDPACFTVYRCDAIPVVRETSAPIADAGLAAKAVRSARAKIPRDDLIRVARPKTTTVKKDDC